MKDAEREEFLAGANIAVLGTVDSKGRPHATPVWYFYDDGEFRVSLGGDSQKAKNIRGNPNVSFVVDSRGLPPLAVMVQGEATFEPPLTDSERLALAQRYLGEEIGKRYAEGTANDGSITIRIKPRKTVIFDPRMG